MEAELSRLMLGLGAKIKARTPSKNKQRKPVTFLSACAEHLLLSNLPHKR
jgi:hypothetical protein